MLLRIAPLLLVWFTFPSLVVAQVSEEDDSETIAASGEFARPEKTPNLSQVAKLIVQKTNEFRQDQGLDPVEPNSQLTKTAQYFADYMAKTDRYGHTADGSRPSERARKHGYEYCLVTENIAYQFSSVGFATEELAEKVFEGWKNSPEHRKNMLNSAATETGVAVSQSDKTGNFYSVQMFGRPKSKRIEFQVANQADATVEYQIGDRTFPLPPRYTRTHQRCRPAELTFQWEDDSRQQAKKMQAGNGEKYIITANGDELTVNKE